MVVQDLLASMGLGTVFRSQHHPFVNDGKSQGLEVFDGALSRFTPILAVGDIEDANPLAISVTQKFHGPRNGRGLAPLDPFLPTFGIAFADDDGTGLVGTIVQHRLVEIDHHGPPLFSGDFAFEVLIQPESGQVKGLVGQGLGLSGIL